MATCVLKVVLDDPGKTYSAGEEVEGEVVVRALKDTNVKSLEISSGWATHGRGNVASETVQRQDAFSGTWKAGEEYRYRFRLATSAWPPTYYGNFLNVSHHVKAQAKIAWAFDPKARTEYKVIANALPVEDETQTPGSGVGKIIGWIIGSLLVVLVLAFFIFLLPFLLVVGLLAWFFTSYLPKSITGKVDCAIDKTTLKAGDEIQGSIRLSPKRRSRINGIKATVRCQEVCISGSGTNKQTHTHDVVSHEHVLRDAGPIASHENIDLSFQYQLPDNAPPSLDLPSNDLKWTVEFRVDIPRWPDYTQSFDLSVLPSPVSKDAAADYQIGEDEWLTEVYSQLRAYSDDPENLALILEAIRDHVFRVALTVGEEIQRPAEADEIHGGHWRSAEDTEHGAQSVLLHTDQSASSRKVAPGQVWRGLISIIGWNAQRSAAIIKSIAIEDR